METNDFSAQPDEGSEHVIIHHPNPVAPTHFNSAPQQHVHNGRLVACKKGCAEITLEPMYGHAERHKYKRTDDVDYMGRPIFTEAK